MQLFTSKLLVNSKFEIGNWKWANESKEITVFAIHVNH
jgi:hypothetical protein